jgi:endonuclease YncB( thermonuclease family)
MKGTPRLTLAGRMSALAGTVLSGALLLGSADANRAKAQMTPGELGRVSSIVDGDTLFVDESLKVRLSAIQAPKLPLGRPGFKAWPLADEAKAALTKLAYEKPVSLYYGGEQRDRYERALAQVFTPNKEGIWLQEDMVRLGMARVYTWPDTWQDSARLYAAEREARAARRGIWDHPFYAVRSPDPNNLAQDVDSFQLVEGIITSTADVRGRVYLNFGADYRTDFTVAIAKSDRKRFKKASIDPMSLEGARVRVRGWIELQNGPVIWLDHPERLEILN